MIGEVWSFTKSLSKLATKKAGIMELDNKANKEKFKHKGNETYKKENTWKYLFKCTLTLQQN